MIVKTRIGITIKVNNNGMLIKNGIQSKINGKIN